MSAAAAGRGTNTVHYYLERRVRSPAVKLSKMERCKESRGIGGRIRQWGKRAGDEELSTSPGSSPLFFVPTSMSSDDRRIDDRGDIPRD
jgi:hypothetical protein